MVTVLLTDISSYKSAVIARHLAQSHPTVRVIATDHRRYTSRVHTRWVSDVRILPCRPPMGSCYVKALGNIISDESVDYLIPVGSDEMRSIMSHRHYVGDALRYASNSDLYFQLDNKSSFAQLLNQLHLPQPRVYHNLHAPLPLVVKPILGSSARGVRYIHSEDDRSSMIARFGSVPKHHVIQEFVAGEGVGFSGFFHDGTAITAYAHRRVSEFPVSGGSSVVRSRYTDTDLPVLEQLVACLLQEVRYSGFAMFEFKRRGPGDFCFIECNPRVWGSMHQSLADGVDHLAAMLGLTVHGQQMSSPISTVLFPLNVLAACQMARSGRWTEARMSLGAVALGHLDVNPLTDPLGLLALVGRGR
jgi:carbamoylphosphate synthase large subunit